MRNNEYIMAIDLARVHDKTTALIGKKQKVLRNDGNLYGMLDIVDAVQMERTDYITQAKRFKKILGNTLLSNNTDMLFDITGVGMAVCDIFRDLGMNPLGIMFTSGSQVNVSYDTTKSGFKTIKSINVPKKDLVDATKTGMDQNRIRIAKGIPYEKEIRHQLVHYSHKETANKNIIFGNDSEGGFDDFVSALMMMSWFFIQYEGQRSDFRYEKTIEASDYHSVLKVGKKRRSWDYDPSDYI